MSNIRKPVPKRPRPLAFSTVVFTVLSLTVPWSFAQEGAPTFDPFPLRPADTSSPQDTLESFHASVNEAHQHLQEGKPEDAIHRALRRARGTLDFSQVPERGEKAKEIESILLLKEILDRIELPVDEDIPGDEALEGEGELSRWTIPNTQITLARVEEGPGAGEFLFTAGTVDRLREFYEYSKHLPYKPGALVGFYEDYRLRPGLIVPRSWAAMIPRWAKTTVLGESLWQWSGFALVVIVAFFLIGGLLRWGKKWDERVHDRGALIRLGLPLSVLASLFVLYLSGRALFDVLRFAIEWWNEVSTIFWALMFLGIGWFILLVTRRMADVVNEVRSLKESSVDGQLVQTLFRLLGFAILICLVLVASDFYGMPLTAVLAGLSIGGLAVALAVRPTLENIIGGLTLFVDKPVRIGDYCRYGADCGTVENIGLRSTRLRKLDDTLVSVPNADFSQRELINYERRRCILYETTLGLRYETTPEQLRYVMTKLREMLIGHPKVSPESLRVRFYAFGAYSLDLKLFAYVRTRQWLDYLAIREDINLRIIGIVREAGTGFAFPSQTAYLGRDSGLDLDRGQEAEKAVQEWRSRGELPFPEFSPDVQNEKEDALDYPPTGSPDYKPRRGVEPAVP